MYSVTYWIGNELGRNQYEGRCQDRKVNLMVPYIMETHDHVKVLCGWDKVLLGKNHEIDTSGACDDRRANVTKEGHSKVIREELGSLA